jgi:pimeloyl-ACP methyl ester carboxylesterase
MRKARSVVGALVLALFVVAFVVWGTRARWLPYAIAAAPNAGKTVADLDKGDSLRIANLDKGDSFPAAGSGAYRDLRVEVGPPAASLAVRVLEPSVAAAAAPATAAPAAAAAAAAPAATAAAVRGTIFVLHGIRDSKRSMVEVGEAFRGVGYRVVLVDLRGQGQSTGEWLSFGAREGGDLKEVADALVADGALALPVGVYGPSYGGAAALQMARRDARVRAVVTVATYTRMRDVVPLYAERVVPSWILTKADVAAAIDRAGVLGDFRPDDADSITAIGATTAEVLLIHGRADGNIPWQQSASLHDAARSHSELLLVDDRDHRTIMSDAAVMRASVAWFDRWLAPPPPQVQVQMPVSAEPSAPSGVGGPCFVSLVRNVDGTPSAEQRCAPNLVCDYAGAVVDGPGKCKQP